MEPDSPVRRVVVLGGGSSGWLTAGVIAAEHQAHLPSGIQVTLVESPDVKTIGVGEGTWPTMRDTLRQMGVSESDFIVECDASFKQGTKFINWIGGEYDYYYHPFVLPQGYLEANLAGEWLARHRHTPFADLVSFQPHLCESGKAPKQTSTPEFAAVANYAYHLDAGKFGAFLQRHCRQQLGVRHVEDHVVGVESSPSGDIAALATRSHGLVKGDLFIDCTGFASMLIGKHFNVPFLSQRHLLFNNTAYAVQVPYRDRHSPIASSTISTATGSGWIWDIGLSTRRGLGHVCSSAHCSDDHARRVLREYVAETSGLDADSLETRKFSFEPGYRQKFWHRNCVAVGIAAGFIEPLEASALVLIELSAAMISNDLPATRRAMDIVARRFNERFQYRWGRIVDFLKLHYVLSKRDDTDYWRDNGRPESNPERLSELLTLWRHRPPARHDFYQNEEIFPSASYQYVLYGMGFRPERPATARRSHQSPLADKFFRESAKLTSTMLKALPTNRELIHHIQAHGLQRARPSH